MELPLSEIATVSTFGRTLRIKNSRLPLPGRVKFDNITASRSQSGRTGVAMELAVATSPMAELESRISALKRLERRGKHIQAKAPILGRSLLQTFQYPPAKRSERQVDLYLRLRISFFSCLAALGSPEALVALSKAAQKLSAEEPTLRVAALEHACVEALLNFGDEGKSLAQRELPHALDYGAHVSSHIRISEFHVSLWSKLCSELISNENLEANLARLLTRFEEAPKQIFTTEVLNCLEQLIEATSNGVGLRLSAAQILFKLDQARARQSLVQVVRQQKPAIEPRLLLWACVDGIFDRSCPPEALSEISSSLCMQLDDKQFQDASVLALGLLKSDESVASLKARIGAFLQTKTFTDSDISTTGIEQEYPGLVLLALRVIRSEESLSLLTDLAKLPRGFLARWCENKKRSLLRPLAQQLLNEDAEAVESRCRRLLRARIPGTK